MGLEPLPPISSHYTALLSKRKPLQQNILQSEDRELSYVITWSPPATANITFQDIADKFCSKIEATQILLAPISKQFSEYVWYQTNTEHNLAPHFPWIISFFI